MQYGLPYKGSKNKIAKEIIDQLPPAEHFYDLFAGGCAITHAAMLSGKWKAFTINDLESGIVELFKNAVDGKYRNEDKWINRELFYLLKGSDPYIRYCWSFGNNGENYLYTKEVELFKMHLHNIFFSRTPHETRLHWKKFVREFANVRAEIDRLTEQTEILCRECNVEVTRRPDDTIDAAKIKADVFRVKSADIRNYMRDALHKSGHTATEVDKLLGTNGMAGHYFGSSQWALPTAEAYAKMQTIIPDLTIPWAELNESLESLKRLQSLESLKRLQSLESLKSLQSLERLQRLQSLESLKRLQVYSGDYQAVEIADGSVIYCDIPYKDTDGYIVGEFDYNRFYKWACKQEQPVYISEYWMPEDRFECVWSREKVSTLGIGNKKRTVEKLFVPRK